MDIKDSYLHGTVGVVKSISVSADKLKYTLADIAGTVREVTLPVATQTANGLMSYQDKEWVNKFKYAGDINITNPIITIKQLKEKIDQWLQDRLTIVGSSIGVLGNFISIWDNPEGTTTSGGLTTLTLVNANYPGYALIRLTHYTDKSVYYVAKNNGVWGKIKKVAFADDTSTLVANNLVLKINSGTTEGTSLYTYNGSTAKTLDIKSGTGIGFTNTAGSLQIYNSGVRSIATGTTNGTISVNTNGTSKDVAVKGLGSAAYTSSDQYVIWNNGPDIYYNIYQKSNNKDGYVRVLYNDVNNQSVFGYGYSPTNESCYITNYKKGYDLRLADSLYYRNKIIAYTDSNITGNAASADKLKTKRKLWGLDFDGTADVSGNMTGVGSITASGTIKSTHFFGKLTKGGALFYFGIRDGLAVGIEPVDADGTWLNNGIQLFLDGNVSIGTPAKSEKLYVNGNVKATSFIGNLDGTYVNKLTNYKIANAIGSIAAADSLNTALGKLEFKTDFIYNDLFGTDNDEVINKWHEIVDFIDSVKEGTDITDEFVTRKTNLTITGLKNFTEILTSSKQLILKGPERSDIINVLNADKSITTNAPTSAASIKNALQFNWYDTSWEIGNIRGSSTNTEGFGITAGNSHLCFRVTTTNCYVGSNVILHAGNSHIKNGVITINGTSITPLTTHQSLANYVTLNTDQVVSGKKLFNNQLIIRKDVGSTGASVTDQQHNLLLQVMRYSDTHSVAIGVMPTGTGVIWAKANGIGYNTLYLNPHSNGVAIGCGDNKLPQLNDGYYFHIFGATLSNSTITATKFITSGGTSSLFVKGDGSLDSTAYATTTSLGDYLPRAGGAMNKEAYISWGNNNADLYHDSVSDWSTINGYGLRIISNIIDPATSQAPSHYCTALHVRGSYGFQLACAGGDVNQFYIANLSNKDASGKRIWNTILHSNNYTNYTVKKDGTGATGTWGINITGSAGSVAWGNITGKPTIPTVTDYYWANVKISSTSNNYTNPIFASLLLNSGDATLKMYLGKVRDGYSDGNFCLQTCIDGLDGETHTYATSNYAARNNLILQPRGGLVYIGEIPDPGDTSYKLSVNGKVKAKGYTTSGIINSSLNTGSHIYGNQGGAIINSTAPRNGYVMLSSMPSTNGVFCLGVYKTAYMFYYTAQTTIDAGTNACTKSLTLLDESGNSYFPGDITAVNLKKSGSSDNYVLLGGGGHKTLSSITAASLNSTTVISAKAFSLSNASWTDTGYTFASLTSGTYAVQVTSGSNLVASGIMSVYKNLSDTAGDEIPLHVYGTAGWRPYLRTYANKLLISSNDTSSTKRTVTIKIALIL